MMGAMGATIASGHQIALNYASFMFMVPLAISSATTIHVGHTLGRGDAAGARAAGALGIVICAMVMFVSAIAILLFNDQIAALYTKDASVRELAATLLLMAALFQLSDGVQVGAAGALRGFKDTTSRWRSASSRTGRRFHARLRAGRAAGGGPVQVWIGLDRGPHRQRHSAGVALRVVARRALSSHAGGSQR